MEIRSGPQGQFISASEFALIAMCALGYFVNLSGLAVGNAFSAVFFTSGGAFDSAWLGFLLASPFAGAAIGVPILGLLASRRGCRFALLVAASLLVATSLAEAFSPNIVSLAVIRFVSGTALGGLPPLLFAYLANKIPHRRRRGAAALAVSVFALLAVPATVFLIRWLTPLHPLGWEGWRWALAIHAAIALVCAAFFYLGAEFADLREDEPALVRRAGLLFRDPALRRALIGIVLISFLTPWATIGFASLNGALMVQKGFDVSAALLSVAVAFAGPVVSNVVVAFLIDRVGRRAILIGATLIMAIVGPLFSVFASLAALMLIGLLFIMSAAAFVPVFLLYAAESFPLEMRAQANALGWAVNRAAAAFVPVVLLFLLRTEGSLVMFALMSLTLVAIAALLVAWPARAATRTRLAEPIELGDSAAGAKLRPT